MTAHSSYNHPFKDTGAQMPRTHSFGSQPEDTDSLLQHGVSTSSTDTASSATNLYKHPVIGKHMLATQTMAL
jgi:hypothetical protein